MNVTYMVNSIYIFKESSDSESEEEEGEAIEEPRMQGCKFYINLNKLRHITW